MNFNNILIFAATVCVAVRCDDTVKQNDDDGDDVNVTPPDDDYKFNVSESFPGGSLERDDAPAASRDLLGPTWTMLDLPNLDFYILPFLNYSKEMLEPYFTYDQVRYHWDGNMETHRRELNYALKEWKNEVRLYVHIHNIQERL